MPPRLEVRRERRGLVVAAARALHRDRAGARRARPRCREGFPADPSASPIPSNRPSENAPLVDIHCAQLVWQLVTLCRLALTTQQHSLTSALKRKRAIKTFFLNFAYFFAADVIRLDSYVGPANLRFVVRKRGTGFVRSTTCS